VILIEKRSLLGFSNHLNCKCIVSSGN